MGKKDLIISSQIHTMNVNKDIIWGITRRNNAFLYADRFTSLSSDPFNATNRHSAKNAGFCADSNRVGLTAGSDGKLDVTLKTRRRTVNAAPKLNRKGDARKGNTRKNLRSMGYTRMRMNDKNAMNAFADRCPLLRKRITKLHIANCKAAKNTEANAKAASS